MGAFCEAGADRVTVHFEAATHVHRLLASIRDAGKKPGIAIVPSTPAEALSEVLPLVDLVLVMTVNPGFGGQEIILRCLKKVEKLARMRETEGLDYLLEVDGGINRATVGAALAGGRGRDCGRLRRVRRPQSRRRSSIPATPMVKSGTVSPRASRKSMEERKRLMAHPHKVLVSSLTLLLCLSAQILGAQSSRASGDLQDGIDSFRNGNYDKAILLFHNVITDPSAGAQKPAAYLLIAKSYMAVGSLDDAERNIEFYIATYDEGSRLS